MAAGKIGIPEGQADLPLKPHHPSWEGPKDELPTSTLGNGFRRRSTTTEVLIALLRPYVEP